MKRVYFLLPILFSLTLSSYGFSSNRKGASLRKAFRGAALSYFLGPREVTALTSAQSAAVGLTGGGVFLVVSGIVTPVYIYEGCLSDG